MKNLNYLILKKPISINDFNHFANTMTTMMMLADEYEGSYLGNVIETAILCMEKYYTNCMRDYKNNIIPYPFEENAKQYNITNIPSFEEIVKQYKIANNEQI